MGEELIGLFGGDDFSSVSILASGGEFEGLAGLVSGCVEEVLNGLVSFNLDSCSDITVVGYSVQREECCGHETRQEEPFKDCLEMF